MKITTKLLQQHNACYEQVAEFTRLFPEGCRPTIDNLTILRQTEYRDEYGNRGLLDTFWLFSLLDGGQMDGPHRQRGWEVYHEALGDGTGFSYNAAQEARLAYLSAALLRKR